MKPRLHAEAARLIAGSRSIWSTGAILVMVALSGPPVLTQPSRPGTSPGRQGLLRLIERPRVPPAPEVRMMPPERAIVREHFAFFAQEGERVPGTLSRPASAAGRRPAVILLHGTGGSKADARIVQMSEALVRRGFIAVSMDGRHHGERVHGGAGADAYVSAMLRTYRDGQGLPFLYDTVWDVMRLIDYLVTRADVDAFRIGLTGISKGGMETYLAAAADPRIAAAVPLIGVQSFRWGLEHDAWQSRVRTFRSAIEAAAEDAGVKPVDAAFVRRFYDRVAPGIYREFDAPAMLPLIAPRPLLVINGDSDPRTPLAGVEEAVAAARPAYMTAKVPERLSLHLQPQTGHAVTDAAAQMTVDWFVRWLGP